MTALIVTHLPAARTGGSQMQLPVTVTVFASNILISLYRNLRVSDPNPGGLLRLIYLDLKLKYA